MVDPRFFKVQTMRLQQLLQQCALDYVQYDDRHSEIEVSGAGTVPHLAATDIGFVQDRVYGQALQKTQSGIVFVTPELRDGCHPNVVALVTPTPYKDFVAALACLFGDVSVSQYGLNPNASEPKLGHSCKIAQSVVFGEKVELGDNVVIGANSVIGNGVKIGSGSVIGDNASVYAAIIGENCRLHAGVRIGNEGFGFIPTGDQPIKIPQLGRVIIQEGVEIGPNSCVDRGMLDDTIIGAFTKIDNMVQIAHNVQIGRNCQISSQTGIAGSSVIGDNVLLGGRVGVVNKAKVGNKASVMACSLVTKDVPDGGSVAGNPAIDVKKWRRQVAQARKAARN